MELPSNHGLGRAIRLVWLMAALVGTIVAAAVGLASTVLGDGSSVCWSIVILACFGAGAGVVGRDERHLRRGQGDAPDR